MRDTAIASMHQQNGRRAALLLGQHEWLRCRQDAFEAVLKVSTWRDRLLWIFKPLDLLTVVDAVQMKMMRDARAQLEAAASKPHIIKPAEASFDAAITP